MNDTEQYFTSNTIFYFMEGVHIIADFQSLLIHQVSNLTLVGQEVKEQGQNDTQHKAVIKCASPTSNIIITFSNHITVMNLTITNCGRRWHLSSLLSLQYYSYLDSRGSRISIFALFNVTLGFIETVDVTLRKISVVDNSGIGLCAVNGFDIVINESIFSHNNYNPITQGCNDLICNGGNIVLLFTDMILLCSYYKFMYSASIGAIALYSSSILFIMEDTLVSFINNHAEIFGCAIYKKGHLPHIASFKYRPISTCQRSTAQKSTLRTMMLLQGLQFTVGI